MNTVVVTGAAGFLGANLTKALSDSGYYVYAIVRPDSPHNNRISSLVNVETIELPIDKLEELPEQIHPIINSPNVFYHLAWHGGRYDSMEQNKNIDEALVSLRVAHQLGCKRWIATGSQAEYGARTEMLTEDLTPDPFCAYGAAKVATCYTTRYYAKELGIDWIWGRIHSLYGKYEPMGRMLPDLIDRLKCGQSVTLSSCTQYWNYLDVRDASECLIALAEKGHSGEIYNIAAEESKPLKEYVEMIHMMFGSNVKITYGNPPTPYVSLKPSIEKIKNDTGWEQKISFECGLMNEL